MSDLKPIQIAIDEKMIVAALQCDQLDEVHIQDMHGSVTIAAEKTPQLPVVLDMSHVTFVPSLSLGALINLMKICKQRNQRFMLTGLQPSVRQVMTACRLDRLFEIYDTLADVRHRLSV
jgi:anti-anti-sigma factor